MKKILAFLLIGYSGLVLAQSSAVVQTIAKETILDKSNHLMYVSFKDAHKPWQSEASKFIESAFFTDNTVSVELLKQESDPLGFTHLRFSVVKNGVVFDNKQIIAHCIDGKILSVNGDLEMNTSHSPKFILSESQALQKALNKINAKRYKWENRAEEAHMAMALNQPNFSYYPKAQKVITELNGVMHSAYKFNIYAEEPLYRANVLVDATTGKILEEQNLICTADVPATALTKYSATQTITCDQQPSLFRLRETGRGQGIDTYNMKNTTTYSATDFTNTSTSWTTTGVDQAATDAHWGAEVTYDYYMNVHNRNSIDGNGFKLLSYVHYSTNYNNAFWDGQRMTYGDGNGTTFTILTGLDVCGHEVTHGLTSNSSQLVYQNESGALNESYSDIFGTCIENFGRPANWNWKIGTDITPSGNGIRNMQNPNQFNHPDTYMGTNYYTGTNDNGGVHTNSGVSNFWFYLLSQGGTGTNDISNTYTVNGIGMASAARIAFRALTVYYTPSTNFANARILSIQAAKDLFGNCSNEVIQTTNAWHAVGVGSVYSPSAIAPNFVANTTNICSLPATISFSNTTANGVNYTWDMGDNTILTSTNPVHTYSANGTYTVKLKATGCISNVDSITKPSYIVINAPAAPSVTGAAVCQSGSVTLLSNATGNNIKWYDSPSLNNLINTGNSYTTPNINSSVTYYVVNTTTNAPSNGGILTNTGGGFLTNPAQYLIFDVTQNSTLLSVVVYAQTSGNRTIELRNSGNTVLSSSLVTLSAGANTVNLNFNLSVGTNYQLGLNGSSASDMYRTNTGVAYPYNVANCVSIKNSSAGSGFYYWFYNWRVQKGDCVSPAVAVTATVNPAPSLNIAVTSTDICREAGVITMTPSPAGGNFSGTGVSGNTFDPSVGVGSYTVTYAYTDANGCSGNTELVLNVSECTTVRESKDALSFVTIYPNPAKDVLVIQTKLSTSVYTASVYDATGRLVLSKEITGKEEKLNVSQLPNGVYVLQLKDQASNLRSIKLIKN